MKNSDFSSDAKSWLEFADYDLKSAKWQFKGKIHTSACYAAQQVAEKAIKALILASGKVVPKIHSLDRLINFLKDLKFKTDSIEISARNLDKFYISTRYPGQYGGPEGLYDKEDAQSAIKEAETILKFVKNKLKQNQK